MATAICRERGVVGLLDDRCQRPVKSRQSGYKLISGSDGLEELYHVATDPDEAVDRSDDEPDQTRQLRDRLDEWLGSFTHAETNTAPAMDETTKERLADFGYM